MIRSEQKSLEVKDFRGLEVEVNELFRDEKSWSRLEGFDQIVSGSIRRVRGLTELLADREYPGGIVAVKVYRRTPDDPPILVGLERRFPPEPPKLWDLINGGPPLASFPIDEVFNPSPGGDPFGATFMAVMPGFYTNPIGGTPLVINYLIITAANNRPYQWDGLNSPTNVGTPGPNRSLIVTALGCSSDETKGIIVNIARKYRLTFWNPITKTDSSPSPDDAPLIGLSGELSSGITPNVSPLQPPPDFPYITTVLLWIIQRSADAVGGYTHGRLWVTRDGSEEFFLVKNTVVGAGPGGGPPFTEADDDGAFPLLPLDTIVWDGISDPTAPGALPGLVLSSTRPFFFYPNPFGLGVGSRFPRQDFLLVDPSPLPGENDPPTIGNWGAVYQNRLWLVDNQHPYKLIFSKIENFIQYPVDNFFDIPADNYDEIITLEGQFQQLIIGKRYSTHRIIGTDFTDFVMSPIDPQVGFLSRKGIAKIQGILLFLSHQGIMQWAADNPSFYGKTIKPFIDELVNNPSLSAKSLMSSDSRRGLVVMAYPNPREEFLKPFVFLMMDVSQESPFSLFFIPPTEDAQLQDFQEMNVMEEVELPGGERFIVLASMSRVWRLFFSARFCEALAETQFIPSESNGNAMRKVFRKLKVENPPRDLVYEYWVDSDADGHFGPFPLRMDNFLGKIGRRIKIRFSAETTDLLADPSILSNLRIDYAEIGETRDA